MTQNFLIEINCFFSNLEKKHWHFLQNLGGKVLYQMAPLSLAHYCPCQPCATLDLDKVWRIVV